MRQPDLQRSRLQARRFSIALYAVVALWAAGATDSTAALPAAPVSALPAAPVAAVDPSLTSAVAAHPGQFLHVIVQAGGS